MFNIRIRTVESHSMRYETAGDYFEDRDGAINIVVCSLGNWKYEALLVIHELCEYILVRAAGIPLKHIDDFDIQFEQEREMGMHGLHDEPGDEPDAPYHLQHSAATAVERICAMAMGINWRDYSNIVDNLDVSAPRRGKRRAAK